MWSGFRAVHFLITVVQNFYIDAILMQQFRLCYIDVFYIDANDAREVAR